jgi:hypothetical protein
MKHGRTSFAALHESVRGTNATSTNVTGPQSEGLKSTQLTPIGSRV